jgi:Leucine-rich repeat (LRR) protein
MHMPKSTETTPLTSSQLIQIIAQAYEDSWTALDLSSRGIEEIPPEIGRLTKLECLDLSNSIYTHEEDDVPNSIRSLPEEIGMLVSLRKLNIAANKLTSLPESIGLLRNLEVLNLTANELLSLPNAIGSLARLRELNLSSNRITSLPLSIGNLKRLEEIHLIENELSQLPDSLGEMRELRHIWIHSNRLTSLPQSLTKLKKLETLGLFGNPVHPLPSWFGELSGLQHLVMGRGSARTIPAEIRHLRNLRRIYMPNDELTEIPEWIGELSSLQSIELVGNQISTVPESVGKLENLTTINLQGNCLTFLPSCIGDLEGLAELDLGENPLNPVLQSVYEQGATAVKAYLRSLRDAQLLFESKLILVGEGGVGKTTLLRALSGREPRITERTTHGVCIDIHSLLLPHPSQPGRSIQLNGWDFGGQEVYRVTHQFFFSARSVYLVVWEPRGGVQQGQVEDWLKMIQLRVGDKAKVIIVATHALTGERIARIDKDALQRDFGSMIVGYVDVDSLVDDPLTGDKYGMAQLKLEIARAAAGIEHMGMPLNVNWVLARDRLIAMGTEYPRVPYRDLETVCEKFTLSQIEARTLAHLMNDLGYIVYYGEDDRLKDDVVLQPEWLTKAIGFVLEDRGTQEREGVLPDDRLEDVWLRHPFTDEPRYDPTLYPFFLRLMEKFDVAYRLTDGTGSLIAQHVPPVRPPLPWLAGEQPVAGRRRLGMVCVMDDAPPGLVPWIIVRTHQFAMEREGHRLHWQKGLFLRNKPHGEALLELRGREFHIYVEAIWPEYFMNYLRDVLGKLIRDNWPGLEGRYAFTVPCQEFVEGVQCSGRFRIEALQQFLQEGDATIRCQICFKRQDILSLLFGFQDIGAREQLARIEGKLDAGLTTLQDEIVGLESRVANYVMAVLRAIADEAKDGPRLFTLEPVSEKWYQLVRIRLRIRLWCEAEGCQHPVTEHGFGTYELTVNKQWIAQLAPYARFVVGVLRTLVPLVSPAINVVFGKDTTENWGIADQLELTKEVSGSLSGSFEQRPLEDARQGILTALERSGLLALHKMLRELDPTHAKLGLTRVPTATGDYVWLCRTHLELVRPRIPDVIPN